MWHEALVRSDAQSSNAHRDAIAFVDAKGVTWKVACRDLPGRRGRLALDFASATGKRRSAEIQTLQVEELRALSDQAWQTLLANAAVIELE